MFLIAIMCELPFCYESRTQTKALGPTTYRVRPGRIARSVRKTHSSNGPRQLATMGESVLESCHK
jgi:hypothetical protein